MVLSDDQYIGLGQLVRWYEKANHQFIEISGTVGTGTLGLVFAFMEEIGISLREVAFLTYDQRTVIEYGSQKRHTYFMDRAIHKYTRITDFNTLPVLNSSSRTPEYHWVQSINKKRLRIYKVIVVLDSTWMDAKSFLDLAELEKPVILIKDPMLLPHQNSVTYQRDANIKLIRYVAPGKVNPIHFIAHQVMDGARLRTGSFGNMSIVSAKDFNLYNIKAADMVLCLSNYTRDAITNEYRHRIKKLHDKRNAVGERLICMSNLYEEELVNSTESKIRVYLTKGVVGRITRINSHIESTKYVKMNFQPDFYHESFEEIIMERHHLNGISFNSRQLIPDSFCKFEYAYALTPQMARLSHWDRVTLLVDDKLIEDDVLYRTLLYTAITRARQQLTIVI